MVPSAIILTVTKLNPNPNPNPNPDPNPNHYTTPPKPTPKSSTNPNPYLNPNPSTDPWSLLLLSQLPGAEKHDPKKQGMHAPNFRLQQVPAGRSYKG